MRRSGFAGAALLVLAGAFAAAAARPAVTRPPVVAAPDELDVLRRQADELNQFNQQVAGELARGRLGLADATDHLVEANSERPGYLTALRVSVGCPTVREGVARSLIFRAENSPAAPAVVFPALRAEYAALFGRPYTPPRN